MNIRVDRAIDAIASGKPVVVMDDEDRENEADLIMAAQFVDASSVSFFLRHTSGFLCTAITESRARQLDLVPQVVGSQDSMGTAFLVSVDLKHGTTTGISAQDRAATVAALSDPSIGPDDLLRPGHVLPLQARRGGVLMRAGHTEAGVDLCALAGVEPAALICELVTSDHSDMMRGPQAEQFAATHGIAFVTIGELVAYRREELARSSPRTALPTGVGKFEAHAFAAEDDGPEHFVLTKGDLLDPSPMPVRIHSECLTGDVFGSALCDCGEQLKMAIQELEELGRGVLIYMRGHEGRGIGLANKLRAYRLQQHHGLDTAEANRALGFSEDERMYDAAASILRELGVDNVRLMTNNPAKLDALEAAGFSVNRSPLEVTPNRHNVHYLTTKRDRLGHMLHMVDVTTPRSSQAEFGTHNTKEYSDG